MSGLEWLTARPVAHRGLHDAKAGRIENTPSAFAAAIAANYAIECDLQLSADGEAMVHHDEQLGRLTDGSARLNAMTAAELQQVAFRGTADRMLTVGELCDLVAGRVTLVIEIKSNFDGDQRLVARAATVLSRYSGPAALMSFDPNQIAALRALRPSLPRGLVAERRYSHSEWDGMSYFNRRAMAYFIHAPQTAPQFLAYSVADLPGVVPFVARKLFRLPLLTWTVRTEADRRRASRYADQMIFEGFQP
jgi:glycerophosphoryl diester phosphodiesterase